MQGAADTFDMRYPAEPQAVARARRDLVAFAASQGAHRARLADVRLAVSEAITNAVLHGYRGGPGEVRLTAESDGASIWIRVRDDGCGMSDDPPVRSRGLGAGLDVISQLVDDLSVAPRRRGGTELQMRVDLGRVRAREFALA